MSKLPQENTLIPEMVEEAQRKFGAKVVGFFNGRIMLKLNRPTFPDRPYMTTVVGAMENKNFERGYEIAFFWSHYDLKNPELGHLS